jgi:hypothetical protein
MSILGLITGTVGGGGGSTQGLQNQVSSQQYSWYTVSPGTTYQYTPPVAFRYQFRKVENGYIMSVDGKEVVFNTIQALTDFLVKNESA